jgi:choline dehydrogenase-like flavoprotein
MAHPEAEVFDIIVVSGGTAGCVMASRLGRQNKPCRS